MSRITGSDAFGMMEAYNAVYTAQELTEEQVWEEVENWVNSLVEEGYDLSEYTWEDMYEEYLNEIIRPTTEQMTAPRNAPQASPKPAPSTYRPGGGRQDYNRRRSGTGQMPPPATPRTSSAPYQSRFAGARDAAFNRARQIQGSPVVGPRVAAPAPARPVAQASTRPSAPAPSPSTQTTTSSTTTPAPAATSTRPSLAQQRAEIEQMRKRSQQRIISQGGTPATPLVQSFDPFDIVQGYLIDEGYAETEEAAAVIMANMSEEWRDEILDEANRPEQEMIKKGLLKPGRQVGRVRNLERDSANSGGSAGAWYGQDSRDQPSIKRPGRSFGRTGPNNLKQRRQKDAQKFDAFHTSQRRDEHNRSRGKKTKG
jgi:hypothetical protein